MEKEILRIVIADDHQMFRDGLKLLCSKQPNMKLVGEARDGAELIEVVKSKRPHVVITDIRMPAMDGVEATRRILELYPDTLIIAISMSEEERMVIEMIEAGAKGYLSKDAGKDEILSAIDFVVNNKPYYSHSITSMLARLATRKKKATSEPPVPHFTEKEMEVIRLLCREMTSKEIGREIFASPKTIELLRSRIIEKIKVKSAIGIVLYAARNNLCK